MVEKQTIADERAAVRNVTESWADDGRLRTNILPSRLRTSSFDGSVVKGSSNGTWGDFSRPLRSKR